MSAVSESGPVLDGVLLPLLAIPGEPVALNYRLL